MQNFSMQLSRSDTDSSPEAIRLRRGKHKSVQEQNKFEFDDVENQRLTQYKHGIMHIEITPSNNLQNKLNKANPQVIRSLYLIVNFLI